MNIFLFITLFFLSFPGNVNAYQNTVESNTVSIQKSEGGSTAEVHLSTGTIEGDGEVRVEQKAKVSVDGEEIHITKVITQTSETSKTAKSNIQATITITKTPTLTPRAGQPPKPTHENKVKEMLEEKTNIHSEESFAAQILRFIRSLFHKV